MVMQIEAGKYYMTRDGRKVGPMRVYKVGDGTFDVTDTGEYWGKDGKHAEGNPSYGWDHRKDLIAEWHNEPEPAPLTAIEHLRKAAELFLAAGNDGAAFETLGVILDHE